MSMCEGECGQPICDGCVRPVRRGNNARYCHGNNARYCGSCEIDRPESESEEAQDDGFESESD